MDIIVIKYMQLFCLTIFFTNNMNCHEMLIKNEKDNRQLYYVASCTGQCLEDKQNETLSSCYYSCLDKTYDSLKPLHEIQCNINVELFCRGDTQLVLQIIVNSINQTNNNEKIMIRNKYKRNMGGTDINYKEMSINQQFINDKQDDDDNNNNNRIINNDELTELCRKSIKLIKVQNTNQIIGDTLVYMANTSIITIKNLSPNTTYNISATIVTTNEKYIYLINDKQYKTLPYMYKPNSILNFTVNSYNLNKFNETYLDAEISWLPASDMTCSYEVVYFCPTNLLFNIKQIERRKPEELYFCPIRFLEFDEIYTVAIRGINPNNLSKESGLTWSNITTPSCLDWYHNNLDICAPPLPDNLKAVELSVNDNNHYNINISWDPGYLEPYNYIINIYDLYTFSPVQQLSYGVTVPGNQTEVFFPSIELTGRKYEVQLIASTTGGNRSISIVKIIYKKFQYSVDSVYVRNLLLIILGPILMIAFIFFSILLICHRRAKLKRYEERCRYFQELEQHAPVDPNSNFGIRPKEIQSITMLTTTLQTDDCFLFNYDKMEILRDNIKLLDVLGEGAFGLVRKGLLKSEHDQTTKYVAVKMLKDHPAIEDIKEFRREIEVMKSVGEHPNIVGIIGHCTKNVNEMMLLTVYCSKGNLLNYLRTEWQRISKIGSSTVESESLTPSLMIKKIPENVFNFDTSFVDKESLKYKNLIDDKESIKTPTNTLTSIDNVETDNAEQIISDDNIITDIIVNKLYDKLIIENKNEETELQCTNSCKCLVEILPNANNPQVTTYSHLIMNNNNNDDHDDDDNKINGKQKILVQDCFCRKNIEKKLPQEEKKNSEVIIQESPEDLLSVENRGYDKTLSYFNESSIAYNDWSIDSHSPEITNEVITSLDLLNFAKQIASGMTFLSQNKVVHRDLAARNVLVCSDKTIKIADFGLSRDIYQENMYKKTGNGKLPIKWLALESLTHQVYTSQSDVWAYGILLFEIVTLGGNPYPSIPTNRLLKLLKTGYRMEKPKNCSTEIYDLMNSCWRTSPHERPTFNDIGRILDEYLIKSTEVEYIQLNNREENKKFIPEKVIQDEAYLKPI